MSAGVFSVQSIIDSGGTVRSVLLTRQAVAVAAVAGLGVLGISAPAIASAAARHTATRTASHPAATRSLARPALPAGERYACPPAPVGQMTCMSIIKTAARSGFAAVAPGSAVPAANGPYGPTDLRKAYKLMTAARKGAGRTIAIVDAFSDPHANADLKVYRSHFHLPACTTSNGCLRILNQHGKSKPLPRADANWAVEESLDLDMVSAICPKCHILLIEANSDLTTNLAKSEDTAIARGAKYVSNSWGNSEFNGESTLNRFFNHPGHVIVFAAGDLGFGSTYPASQQFVTSVGGTSLKHSGNGRGWTESVWGTSANNPPDGTASGCSAFEAKPSWQRVDVSFPGGCQNRTENDAAAVADPNTGVLVYDTYQQGGALVVGGTSAATPIITAIYALAGAPVARTYPAEYPYLHAKHLFDVTSGVNGQCGTPSYLCHGVRGFDGPTGLGTPDGTTAFGLRAARRVTLVDPGTQTGGPGATFSLKITGLDTRKVSSLHFTETGLPPGLTIHSIPHSTNGQITGTLPSSPGTFHVTITGHDGSASGTTHFDIVVS
jgi:Subtilase family